VASRLEYVKRFSDLEVYERQRALSREVFRVTADFPSEEKFSPTDQIRRSSRSIGAQIAEAWAKRRYPKHFISKLTDADGEQLETQHWLTEAFNCGYLSDQDQQQSIDLCLEIGRMLGSMIHKADAFSSENCTLKDEAIPYLTTNSSDVGVFSDH